MCDQSIDQNIVEKQQEHLNEDFNEDDDDIRLPADTLAILNEFLQDKYDNQTEELENGKTAIKIEEDWVREVNKIAMKRSKTNLFIYSNSVNFGMMKQQNLPFPNYV